MIELFEIIKTFLDSIPPSASTILVGGILLWAIKCQNQINKENMEKFRSGVTNFTMINQHFEEVREETKAAASNTEAQLTLLQEQIKEVHKMVLKNTIYNESMDLFERVAAYDEYIRLEGNGITKRYYDNVLKPEVDERLREENTH